MHIAQRKELDVHKTKQKRDKNRTTTSLVLDSSMQSGSSEFRQNQRIWLRLSSVFESRRISFFKIFLVILRAKVQLERTAKVRVRWHSAVRPEPLLLVTVAFHTSQLKIPRIHRFKQISSHRADRDQ